MKSQRLQRSGVALPHAHIGQSRGVIMVVVMVILFVVTMITMTGLNNASLQDRIATNAQNANRVFQGGESAIVSALKKIVDNNVTDVLDAMRSESGYSTKLTYSELSALGDGESTVDASVQVRFIESIMNDEGMTLGGRAGPTRARLEIIGDASMNSVNTATQVSQGITFQGVSVE